MVLGSGSHSRSMVCGKDLRSVANPWVDPVGDF